MKRNGGHSGNFQSQHFRSRLQNLTSALQNTFEWTHTSQTVHTALSWLVVYHGAVVDDVDVTMERTRKRGKESDGNMLTTVREHGTEEGTLRQDSDNMRTILGRNHIFSSRRQSTEYHHYILRGRSA
uniref:Integrase zinc-binding domain-containing protein n=1 Tax=Ascaris lumbricoides TaxID=6252 RepID=A0A0M3HN63_ASCLU